MVPCWLLTVVALIFACVPANISPDWLSRVCCTVKSNALFSERILPALLLRLLAWICTCWLAAMVPDWLFSWSATFNVSWSLAYSVPAVLSICWVVAFKDVPAITLPCWLLNLFAVSSIFFAADISPAKLLNSFCTLSFSCSCCERICPASLITEPACRSTNCSAATTPLLLFSVPVAFSCSCSVA